MHGRNSQRGFTLIEMSIVLVIIGLIVGGILVGQSLVGAAAVRATISQINKYNSAVNVFRDKYGALPGDLNNGIANQFGFAARGNGTGLNGGQGDGNGIIEGTVGQVDGFAGDGETTMFWVDLSSANGLNVNLIEDTFNTATATSWPTISTAALPNYFPLAKLGGGNYVYVYSTGGINYFGIAALKSVSNSGWVTSSTSMTVNQAYSLDQKVDDGLPTTGTVTATYTGVLLRNAPAAPANAANPVTSTTCYDSAALTYAMSFNGGTGANCAVSFRFQ